VASQAAASQPGTDKRHFNTAEQTCILTDATDHSITSIVATGATDFAPMTYRARTTVSVTNGASNNVIFTVEGSCDGSNFATMGWRPDSATSYVVTASTVSGGATVLHHLDPGDYIRYLRVNVSTANANGTTFTVCSET